MKFEDIQKANASIVTTDIKGKQYSEVNQRIKAFRMLYPEGTIETGIVSLENGVCVMRANIYSNIYKTKIDDSGEIVLDIQKILLGTGTAYEKENSTFINKTSYIENCETSAVGRALAMCGIGIDTSIASAEEVTNAINNQEKQQQESLDATVEFQKILVESGTDLEDIENYFNKKYKELTNEEKTKAIEIMKKKIAKKGE